MHVDVVAPADLTAGQLDAWRHLQDAAIELQSPYFHPEFTRLAASARTGVAVAVATDGDGPFGFFPFHDDGGIGGPVAGQLTDFQGIVIDGDRADRAGFEVDDLLRGAGLRRWHYDHLLANQHWFAAGRTEVVPSATIDLRNGYDAYVEDRRQHGGSRFKDLGRRQRRMERELGPVRFEAHVEDEALLAQIIEWKAEQFVRTGLDDPFQQDWVTELVTAVHRSRVDGFAGALSALYAGDELVAAHLGMHTDHVWHYWFPSYDHRFNKYSPGLLLLLAIAEEAAGRGMHTVDLGKGDDAYKTVFGNGAIDLAEGCAALPSMRWELQKAATAARARARELARYAIRSTPLGGPIRTGLDRVRARR